MPRTIAEATTRLPDPVKLSDDVIRHYQLRPIPGQIAMFAMVGTVTVPFTSR